MKFTICKADRTEEVKPCKEAKPTSVEELRQGKKETVLKWYVEINTIPHLMKLIEHTKSPIIVYPNKSIIIYNDKIE